ncbi:uncharacterized protein Triagg1_5861 [Trichoderma aggressivum f. europaeum]|uniref:Uncharacterized protein n=1 Tax=Trichoderma aggressivum f. europaeum TaxID=173218 RepID=A0AAE1M4D8_9HYPO|nr:hypothetical protein Triagg1_5861 [Trichoderma aggressivum f. europaeum]
MYFQASIAAVNVPLISSSSFDTPNSGNDTSFQLTRPTFVTGAASGKSEWETPKHPPIGIGEQTAYALANYGITKLAITDINLRDLEAVAANVQRQWPGVEVMPLELDVSKPEQAKSVLSQVVERFGRLDIAVNNAGVTGRAGQVNDELDEAEQMDELDEADWSKVLSTNLRGIHFCQQEELHIMKDQEDLGPPRGRGSIINVSSLHGLIKLLYSIQYTASAAAKYDADVIGITRADAVSHSGFNIRIKAICPGYIETPTTGSSAQSQMENRSLDEHVKETPLRRLGQPEEIADGVVFLASSLSSSVNGFGLAVNGGYSCV